MVKRIDILIPVLDGYEYLLRLLHSIERNTSCDYRIYIFNNGSENIQDIKKKFKKIEIINSEKNIGFAPALNRLIEISISPYILITNQDIWFYDDVITKLLKLLDDNEFIGAAPQILSENGEIQRTAGNIFPNIFNILVEFFSIYERIRFFPFNLSYIFPVHYHKKNMIVSHVENCFVIYKREVFKEYGLFDEEFKLYFEDIELQRRFYRKGKIYYCKDIKVYHKGKGITMLKDRDFLVDANRQRNRSLLLYFKKYRHPLEFIIIHNFLKLFYGIDFLKIK